ncbi:MAG TPA: DUF4349 domain-containing protein [Clostridia bacterium]|nr:DUF4349 domain-containing protein [Clostridia bacterium]
MKCETIRNMISSYIDKDLNDIEKAELEKHIAECKECREEYESMLDIIAVCGNLEEIELPQNFRAELHQRLVEEKKKKSFFSGIMGNRNMRMASGLVAAALVIAIGLGSLPLFLYNNNMKMSQENGASPGYGAAAPAAPPSTFDADSAKRKSDERQYETAAEQPQITSVEDTAIANNSLKMEFSENLLADRAAPDRGIESSRSGRMVIRTGNLSVNVEDVEKAAADIKKLTEDTGGYVENSQIDIITMPPVQEVDSGAAAKETVEKYANMTVRVPEASFDNIFNSIKGMGKLVNENTSGNDITTEYRDTAARVDNLKIQEQSLKQLMTKAKTVDEILKIETELNRVRTEIDIKSGDLKRWDNLVQLSTIHIYMRELKPEELKSVDVTGMWGKAYQGFIKAINNIVVGLEKTFIVLVTAIPYLIAAGVLAVIGVIMVRRIKMKKKQ